jgi:hypothetical protein
VAIFSISSASSNLFRVVAKTVRCADRKLPIQTTLTDSKTIDRVIRNETEELRKLGESYLVYLSANQIKINPREPIDGETTISKTEEIGETITKTGSSVKYTA